MSDRSLLLRVHGNFDHVVALVDDVIADVLHAQTASKTLAQLQALLLSVTKGGGEAQSLSELGSTAMLSGAFGYPIEELNDIAARLRNPEIESEKLVQRLNKMANVLDSERVTIAHRIGGH